jgi:hypothetical protein
MELIQTVTLGSAASSISFSTLPTSYDDILIVVSGRTDRASVTDDVKVEFNGVNTNQSVRLLFGTGSSASSATDTLIYGWTNGGNSTSNTFGSTQFYIPNYRSAAAKSVSIDAINEGNQTTQYQGLAAAQWNSTAAITDITLRPYTGPNFVTGTSASLYGIKSARSFAKATGGTIFYDAVNNKVVHVFTASGTFTPTANITCEYLVIAGGGAAGFQGGGGGAGGYREFSAQSLTSGSAQTVTVGGGGAGNTNGLIRGGSGSNSSFGSNVATGGGGGDGTGGAQVGSTGGPGGSGGGGGGRPESAGGAGNLGGFTPVEGFAGGNGNRITVNSNEPGGGGGGAGAAGVRPSSGVNPDGGIGKQSSITGTAVFRAGGGGGGVYVGPLRGTGGLGGGASAPAGIAAGNPGTANTGGGGSGSTNDGTTAGNGLTGGNGGSGIVIVRYDA